MPIESTPEMSTPYFMIRTSYTNAGPEEVDSQITDVIEAALSSVSGYTTMTSRSMEGSSMTSLQFDYSVDTDKKRSEIDEALQNIRLPDDASTPVVMQMAMDSDSIMSLSILATGDKNNLLSYIEESIVPELEKISGVSEVSVSGGVREYISVEIKEEEMIQYGLSMSQIASAISSADFTTTAGTIHRGDIEISLIGSASYSTFESLSEILISLPSGDLIRLTDVANIYMAEQASTSVSRQNGQENISISISQDQSANTISLCNQIVAAVNNLNSQNLGVDINITSNSGQDIMDNIMSVVTSLLIGMAISMLVLFLFLGEPRAAVIVATAMPLSVFAALVIMSFTNISINLMSLGGLVVGIGMMVDNSIVVMESCFKARSAQRTFLQSAQEASRLVAGSITASTITTIVVFLPISLMGGMAGQLFKQVGFTIVFSMTASLISALTLVPLLFVKLRPVEKDSGLIARFSTFLEKKYVKALDVSLRRKILVVIIALALLGGTAVMFTQIDMELMPSGDQGTISLSITTKDGLNVEETDKIMRQIEAIVAETDEVASYSLNGRSSSATLSITLKDGISLTTNQMVEILRSATQHIENCQITVRSSGGMSFSSSSGVSFSLSGTNLEVLKDTADEVKAVMEANDSILSVSTSLSNGSPRAEVVVDPVQAAGYGTTPSAVVSQVRNMISGVTAVTLKEGSSSYSVKVEYPSDRFYDVSDLSGMMITVGSAQVPLTDMANIIYTNAPSQISRTNGKYSVTVTGETRAGQSENQLTTTLTQAINQKVILPEGVTIGKSENMRMMMDEFSAIGVALAVAIWLVFVVLSIQFESMKFAVVVMISVPFALTGAFAALLLTGNTISMTSLIGLIMLVGIVVNNAIVLIDYTNLLRREQGVETVAALKMAGQSRLRPILMTTATTVLSLLPMAIGIGGEVEMMQSMAVVVIGGLLVSTLLTLFLVPIFYKFLDGVSVKRRKKRAKKPALKG